jgi:hypothetical protein
VRIEAVLARSRRTAVVRAMLARPPYEEPAYDVSSWPTRHRGPPAPAGSGRSTRPRSGVRRTWSPRLPRDRARGAGRRRPRPRRTPGGRLRGAGDFLLDAAWRPDADVYVTSDLRHHPAAEFLEQDGPALVDVRALGRRVDLAARGGRAAGEALGDTVETRVSTICTDPWQARI